MGKVAVRDTIGRQMVEDSGSTHGDSRIVGRRGTGRSRAISQETMAKSRHDADEEDLARGSGSAARRQRTHYAEKAGDTRAAAAR
jgi:hypothetical protein